jgi:hypothetical protein
VSEGRLGVSRGGECLGLDGATDTGADALPAACTRMPVVLCLVATDAELLGPGGAIDSSS